MNHKKYKENADGQDYHCYKYIKYNRRSIHIFNYFSFNLFISNKC